jgi:hypothetical protein
MNRIAQPSVKSTLRHIAALAALSVGGTILVGGGHASAQAVAPAEGVVCETLGAHADGTALDCVTTPTGQTWRTKGTRLNPYRIGETATIERYVGGKWFPGYSVKLTGGNPDATADVTLKRYTPPTTWRPTTAGVVITLIGPRAHPAPSAGLKSFFVDAANVEYPLYAYKAGEVDCSGSKATQVNEAKLTQNRGTITGNVCTFVPAASINSTLLMRLSSKSSTPGRTSSEAWFAFL